MRISDWSSDVCSSDLGRQHQHRSKRGDAVEREIGERGHPAQRGVIETGHPLLDDGHEVDEQRLDTDPAQHVRGDDPAEWIVAAQRVADQHGGGGDRSEEHTSELQSLMRISYAVFCLKTKTTT